MKRIRYYCNSHTLVWLDFLTFRMGWQEFRYNLRDHNGKGF